jgi:hypothetical protein
MQVFDVESTGAQLATLLDPKGRALFLKVDESSEKLVVRPGGIPLWFTLLCALVPASVATWYWVNEGIRGALQVLDLIGIAFMCLAVPAGIALMLVIDRAVTSKGDFLILDKSQRTLNLPRARVTIPGCRILRFLEVRAWHTWGDGNAVHSETEWLRELSVLGRSESGEIARYPVLIPSRTRLARGLAEFFGVEFEVLKLDWKMRRRLRALRSDADPSAAADPART